ncbi:MAB_1171c family putative transporter [Krasilnikovia sp. MM14-A1004]|uniref:MAB_1171c family putative transporter n=1 Tax=Krasilnikovia sp. MM14-A1004 TaxID=3373541 RepID=UPI00399D47A7
MHDLVYGVGALAAWIAFAYKANHLRHDRANPALRAMTAAFGFAAVAFTLTVGPVYRPIDAGPGVPNLAKLLIHSCMVLFSVFALQLLSYWRYPARRARRRARMHLVAGLIILAMMATLILLAPIHERYTIHFWKTHAGQTLMLLYLTLFLLALSIGLLVIAWRARQFAALAPELPWLRRGLRITSVGALLSFGYCACRGGYLVLLGAGVHADPLVDIAEPFATVGLIVFLAGLTMPSWGPRTRLDQWSAYRALEPLWSALHEAFPQIALHGSPRGDVAAVGDLDYRLYRRMVEIWDGRLALRPYLAEPPGEPEPDLARRAEAEARAIRDGLRNHSEGRTFAVPAGEERHEARGHELAWLVAVSRSYAHATDTRELDHA